MNYAAQFIKLRRLSHNNNFKAYLDLDEKFYLHFTEEFRDPNDRRDTYLFKVLGFKWKTRNFSTDLRDTSIIIVTN